MKLLFVLKKHSPLGLMLVFPILGAIYAAVNQPGEKVYSLVTPFDQMVPFIKWFIIPYAFWIFYIYICLLFFYKRDRHAYYLTLVTYVVSALISYGIYSVFQTTVPRPYIQDNDIVSELVRYMYQRDQPFNCFPSIHVFSSYLMMKSLYKSTFKTKINQMLIYGMSTLIIVSTMFVKQHVLLDVVGGILLAEVVYRFVSRLQIVVAARKKRQSNIGVGL
ncbi:hypothetical protein B1A99_24540 [Cohnella sp. CIP 111063]|uniref:phosphatase PAP2 family protein n=1 Tax=unclassified Cohnella TaxID=2636738 RepID=UPI000B8BBA58|nr:MULTISPECIES: phosphatase PAP2 family protein [unclassified Cohnella]OXS54953.1 hypothetical protein B1A99_24540 [Cohnella sp. CIP 111063]PRX65095.1 PAP2 superfamily protein [Cohnella sp. SGD-V74]